MGVVRDRTPQRSARDRTAPRDRVSVPRVPSRSRRGAARAAPPWIGPLLPVLDFYSPPAPEPPAGRVSGPSPSGGDSEPASGGAASVARTIDHANEPTSFRRTRFQRADSGTATAAGIFKIATPPGSTA